MFNGDANVEEPYPLPRIEPPARLPPVLLVGGGIIGRGFDGVEETVMADMPLVFFPNLLFPPAHVVLQNLSQNAADAGGLIKRWISPFVTATGTVLCDTFERVCGAARRVGWRLREVARGMVPERVHVTRVTFDER